MRLLSQGSVQPLPEHEVLQQRLRLPPPGWHPTNHHESSSTCLAPVRCSQLSFHIFSSCLTTLNRIPDNVSYELAALAEPLSVLIHANRRAQVAPGHAVLVFGVGAIGLLACAIAKASKASRVVAIDINSSRLSFALSNGFASQTFCPPRLEPAKTPEEQLRHAKELAQQALSHFGAPQGFDVVFECTGAEIAIQTSIYVSHLDCEACCTPLLPFFFILSSDL